MAMKKMKMNNMKFICPECREAIDSADWDKEIQSMI